MPRKNACGGFQFKTKVAMTPNAPPMSIPRKTASFIALSGSAAAPRVFILKTVTTLAGCPAGEKAQDSSWDVQPASPLSRYGPAVLRPWPVRFLRYDRRGDRCTPSQTTPGIGYRSAQNAFPRRSLSEFFLKSKATRSLRSGRKTRTARAPRQRTQGCA